MYLAGAPFDGKPTKIYGFYCRPEKDGKYPAVLEIHGAGMWGRELSPSAGIDYAKNGFACFVMDWCGASDKRVESGWRHSEFKSSGNLAAQAADEVGDFRGGAFVGDLELAGGAPARTVGGSPFAGAEFDDAAVLGLVEMLLARAGVAARLSVAAGADERDAQRQETVAQGGRLARREHQADIGKQQAEGAGELHQLAIGDVRQGLEFSRAGP